LKQNFETIFWVELGALLPVLAVLICKHFWSRSRKKVSRSPQTEKLLRPAGYSLRLKLDAILDSVMENLFAAMVFSGGAVWVARQPGDFAILFAAPFILVSLFFTYRIIAKFREAENYRLGLRGEQAVAESLVEVADSGYLVFHDFIAEKLGNLDHIVVGSRGVFLIETKARSRPTKSKSGQPTHEVIYDGETLQFPKFKESQPVQQAKRNAEWSENYLKKKTGENTPVEALVVLPGWFVRPSVKSAEVKAMNATYLVRFLRSKPEKISPAQVTRITTAIEENCRTIEF
jgi:hypothetical protein